MLLFNENAKTPVIRAAMRVRPRRLTPKVQIGTRRGVIAQLTLAAVVTVLPLGAAHAYVDPNSAGPLYQLLFPLLVAIASVIAAGRRAWAKLWRQLIHRPMKARNKTPVESSASTEDEGS